MTIRRIARSRGRGAAAAAPGLSGYQRPNVERNARADGLSVREATFVE
jgi:hypothetical protein